MKKIIIAALMAVSFISAHAQKGEYYVTPRLNAGYAILTNNDGHGGMLGGVGCNFEYMIADNFGISAAVDFNYFKGDKFKTTVTGMNGAYQSLEESQDMGFLNVPILANYHLGNFAISAGVQPSFLVSNKLKYTQETNAESIKLSYDSTENLNTFQFGIPVGVSYTFKVPVTLGLNATIPVTKLAKDSYINKVKEQYGVDKDVNSKIIPIVLSVGYRF